MSPTAADPVNGSRCINTNPENKKQRSRLAAYDSNPPAIYDSGLRYADLPALLPAKHTMAKIKRNWSRMNRAERLTLGKTVSTALTGNAVFAALSPTAAQFEALRAGSADAEQAIKDNAVILAQLHVTATAAADALLTGFEQVALSAEGISLGAEDKLSTTGFQLTTPGGPAPSVDMTQPQNFSITAGDFDGQIDGHCDPVQGARGYHIQITFAMTGTPVWEDREGSPNTQFSLTGLTSGQRVWVRMRAHGTKGPGPWSDPATKIVP
jgi:hypothetical protein